MATKPHAAYDSVIDRCHVSRPPSDHCITSSARTPRVVRRRPCALRSDMRRASALQSSQCGAVVRPSRRRRSMRATTIAPRHRMPAGTRAGVTRPAQSNAPLRWVALMRDMRRSVFPSMNRQVRAGGSSAPRKHSALPVVVRMSMIWRSAGVGASSGSAVPTHPARATTHPAMATRRDQGLPGRSAIRLLVELLRGAFP
jgi:hypothetical protein